MLVAGSTLLDNALCLTRRQYDGGRWEQGVCEPRSGTQAQGLLTLPSEFEERFAVRRNALRYAAIASPGADPLSVPGILRRAFNALVFPCEHVPSRTRCVWGMVGALGLSGMTQAGSRLTAASMPAHGQGFSGWPLRARPQVACPDFLTRLPPRPLRSCNLRSLRFPHRRGLPLEDASSMGELSVAVASAPLRAVGAASAKPR
jgi:hypothetical protein